MIAALYDFLSAVGYHHPLHPALTHVPVGLTIGSFVFFLMAYFLNRPRYVQTAKHCIVLALLGAIPTIFAGILDWQHFYGGAWMFPIRMKFGLAAALLVLLILIVSVSIRDEMETSMTRRFLLHLLSLLVVISLGYFGGELVYGKKAQADASRPAKESADTAAVAKGAELFQQKCASCHFTDSAEPKFGPGLEGLFDGEKLPVSGRAVSAKNVRRQLREPVNQMPVFDQLEEKQVQALIDYLKTL
ncbi:MAG: DUF2231 domain-containing protein [Thermodesulfobacteriota bacterium]